MATIPLVSIKARIILPGDYLKIKTDLPDPDVVVEAMKSSSWPPPTLATIKNKTMKVTNTTNNPILLDGKQMLSIRMTPTINSSITDPLADADYYDQYKQKPITHPPETETI